MKKYYNVSPIECFEDHLNNTDCNWTSFSIAQKGYLYTYSEEYIKAIYDDLSISDKEFSRLSLFECLKFYPYSSLLTTFYGRNNTIEPIYVITCITDISNSETELIDGSNYVEALETTYENWYEKTIEYSLIKPNNLIDFIVMAVSLSANRENIIPKGFNNEEYGITDEYFNSKYENIDEVFIGIQYPITEKEKLSVEICKKLFLNGKEIVLNLKEIINE